jgi:hypothetical protein
VNAASPRRWDAEYLADSVNTYHALVRGDPIEFFREQTCTRCAPADDQVGQDFRFGCATLGRLTDSRHPIPGLPGRSMPRVEGQNPNDGDLVLCIALH